MFVTSMAETKLKEGIGEAMVMADAIRRGYKVAIPVGEDWRYDLLVIRNGKIERVQCKYTRSNGQRIIVRCRSANNWSDIRYSSEDFDWLAVYDIATDQCYFVPSKLLGNGRAQINLRLTATGNGQMKNTWWAKDFLEW